MKKATVGVVTWTFGDRLSTPTERPSTEVGLLDRVMPGPGKYPHSLMMRHAHVPDGMRRVAIAWRYFFDLHARFRHGVSRVPQSGYDAALRFGGLGR